MQPIDSAQRSWKDGPLHWQTDRYTLATTHWCYFMRTKSLLSREYKKILLEWFKFILITLLLLKKIRLYSSKITKITYCPLAIYWFI